MLFLDGLNIYFTIAEKKMLSEKEKDSQKNKKKSGFVTLNSFISCGKNDFVRREVNFFTCASRYIQSVMTRALAPPHGENDVL